MTAMSSYLRLTASSLLLTGLLMSVCGLSVRVARAQTSTPQITSSEKRIAQDLELIREAEKQHLPDVQRGALWHELALEYHAATEFQKAEDAYNKALNLLKTVPSAREEYASTLDDLASLYLIYGRVDDAESARKQALTVRQKLGNPTGVAVSEVRLSDIALARHDFKKAERLAQRGLQGLESSSNPPRAGVLSALITLTYAGCARGHCAQGLMDAEQAVAFTNTHFESESAAGGFALEALGFAQWKNGATQNGERTMLQGMTLLRARLAPADPRLAGAMLQYQAYLTATNRQAEAGQIHEQVTKMTGQVGVSCQGCAVSVNSLSKTLR